MANIGGLASASSRGNYIDRRRCLGKTGPRRRSAATEVTVWGVVRKINRTALKDLFAIVQFVRGGGERNFPSPGRRTIWNTAERGATGERGS